MANVTSELPGGIFDEDIYYTESKVFEDKKVGDKVEGELTFERYIFQKEEFVIASFSENPVIDITVLGNINFELVQGRAYRIVGFMEEKRDNVRGMFVKQIKLAGIYPMKPKGEQAVIRFLQSLDGIMTTAFKIYDLYGDDSIEVLKTDPAKVAKEVSGISLDKAEKLQQQIFDSEDTNEAMLFLLNIGMSLEDANNYVKYYGETVIDKIKANPYLLCEETEGISHMAFGKVDKIALSLDFDMTDDKRIKAGVLYAFHRFSQGGHTYADFGEILTAAGKALELRGKNIRITKADISNNIEEMINERVLIYEGDRLYSAVLYNAEKTVAEETRRIAHEVEWNPQIDTKKLVADFVVEKKLTLEAKQVEALEKFVEFKSDFCILGGPAGSGKTFVVKLIIELIERIYRLTENHIVDVQLVAPTGKAAKVLNKATGRHTSTIHNALGIQMGYKAQVPFGAPLVVIDETSMLDIRLAKAVLEAVRARTKVIMLGDIHQLVAIGPGNVLEDLTVSGMTKYVELDVIKRQGKDSLIPENGMHILNQEPLEVDDSTFHQDIINNDVQGASLMIKHAEELLKKGVSMEDFQLLVPMKKGIMGTHYLNYVMQYKFNPSNPTLTVKHGSFSIAGPKGEFKFDLVLKEGDKVYNNANIQLPWFQKSGNGGYIQDISIGSIISNGEVGFIEEIFEDFVDDGFKKQRKERVIVVKYDEGYVQYHGKSQQCLEHGFCLSIHKSQGSQWKYTIVGMTDSHYPLLDSGLFYTAETRAEIAVYLVTTERAKNIAMSVVKREERNTTLVKKLLEVS